MNGENLEEDSGYEDSFEEFNNYGLSFDRVEDEETGNVDYYRYQLSWGGPSSELRFYEGNKVVFHFMDWFDGAHRDVSKLDWAQWLVETFEELEMLDFSNDPYYAEMRQYY